MGCADCRQEDCEWYDECKQTTFFGLEDKKMQLSGEDTTFNDCISRSSIIRSIMNYQGGAVDKVVAKKLIEQEPSAQSELQKNDTPPCDICKQDYPECSGDCPDIESLPSVQPEIIRCRDCKHYYYADNRIPQEKRYSCDLDGDRWKPDSFCSFAERRTDG